MKTVADYPPINEPEDYLLMVPTLTGYKPRGSGVLSLTDDRIQFSANVGTDKLLELPAFASAVQAEYNPQRDKVLVMTWFLPAERKDTMNTMLAKALVLAAGKTLDDVDMSFVVDWDLNAWTGSHCKNSEPHHEFSRDVLRLPGQTIYEDQVAWIESFKPELLELSPEEDVEAQTIEAYLVGRDVLTSRRYLVEAATDPRGLDPAQIAAIDHHIGSANVLDVTRTWLANGWNLDNLVQLSAHSRNPYVGTAVSLTMLGDGYLPYAGVVAKLAARAPDTVDLLKLLADQDSDEKLMLLTHQLNMGRITHRLP